MTQQHVTDARLRGLVEVISRLPHVRELGLVVESVRRGGALLRCDYAPRLIGNPESGVLHGGVVTTILDTACGLVSFTIQDEPQASATLDLRIDYMQPAVPEKPVYGWAEAYRKTRNIVFVRGQAYQDSPDDLIASCVATFMLGSVGFSAAAVAGEGAG
ncbi:MAG TPA: PaaI family thioesterase [Gammaproteobacteria bacterium]